MYIIPKFLFLLLLAAHSFSLAGVRVGDSYDAFQDKHVDAFCTKETDTTAVCDQDDATYFGHRAYMRAEFLDNQVIYFAYTLESGPLLAKKILASVRKAYGEPVGDIDNLPDTLDETWSTAGDDSGAGHQELELTYTSAKENDLGHSVIRISLAEK